MIPEEAEKSSSRTPLWKIQLVKDSLEFMMTDEDDGMEDIEEVSSGLDLLSLVKA